MSFFRETPSDELVQQRFVCSRAIRSKLGRVIVPIIELVNHGGSVDPDINDLGIALQGQFGGEVLFRYVAHDTLSLFSGWGFAGDDQKAMSIPLDLQLGAEELVINRDFVDTELLEIPSLGAIWAPSVRVEGDTTILSYLVLGHKQWPRTPKMVLYRLFEKAGLADAEDKFDVVRHANYTSLIHLLESLEDLHGGLARDLRSMARFQLLAMSHCFGPRRN